MKIFKTLFAIATVIYSSITINADRSNDGEEIVGGVIVYQAVQSGVPIVFSCHDVKYENIGQNNVVDPTFFDAKLLGTNNLSYNRDLLVPKFIREGIYLFHINSISPQAFQQTNIKSVNIRASIRTIPQSCFMYCSELESVRFHGDMPHFIDASAFRSCIKLKTISFPAQLKYIGAYAFDQCLSLNEIFIPKDVAQIGESAFHACYGLKSVRFATGHFRTIPEKCFQACDSLTDIIIPEGVSEIKEYAFNNSGLKSITLPTTIRNIYGNALTGTPLREIRCKSATPPWVGPNFTYNQCRQITLHVPRGCENAYRQDSYWRNFPNIIPDL